MGSQAIKPRVSAIRHKLSEGYAYLQGDTAAGVISVCVRKLFKLDNLTVFLHDFFPIDVIHYYRHTTGVYERKIMKNDIFKC